MSEKKVEVYADAISAVVWEWDRFASAKTPVEAAAAVIATRDAISDLSTYHPDYDYETGEIEEV